ncbi:MAG: PilZ domain-containing protein [Phycisphaerae bacterium]
MGDVKIKNLRSSSRTSAAHPVVVCDRRGRKICSARTANISATGVMIVTRWRRELLPSKKLIIEVTLPAHAPGGSRVVSYLARVARVQEIGQLVGVGVEFLDKLV